MELRVDTIQLPIVSRTEEGYLKGEATVSRTGVFRYINPDGTERLELRHPDDILLPESLDTLKSIPITVDHPRVLVNSSNINNLAVGMTGETIKLDGEEIRISLAITHPEGLKAIDKGKRELSMGYTLELIREDGVYNGERYTHRQKNVKYNHLAIVEKARAGRCARINTDGVIEIIIHEDNMEEVKTLQKRIDTLEEEKNELQKQAKIQTETQVRQDEYLNGLIYQLKEENKKLKEQRTDELIAIEAKKRVKLLNKVSKFINLDAVIDKSECEIMELVIKASNPNINLDGRADDYIQGIFDMLLEQKASESNAIENQIRISTPFRSRNDGQEKASKSLFDIMKKQQEQIRVKEYGKL